MAGVAAAAPIEPYSSGPSTEEHKRVINVDPSALDKMGLDVSVLDNPKVLSAKRDIAVDPDVLEGLKADVSALSGRIFAKRGLLGSVSATRLR